jgi:hypothetical protein
VVDYRGSSSSNSSCTPKSRNSHWRVRNWYYTGAGALKKITDIFLLFNFNRRLEKKLDLLIERTGKIMATLDQLVASSVEESTLDDSIIALLASIKE